MRKIPDGVFKPKLSTGERKSDVTTTVAMQITESERAARESKTARLRLERLAYEEANPPTGATGTQKAGATRKKRLKLM